VTSETKPPRLERSEAGCFAPEESCTRGLSSYTNKSGEWSATDNRATRRVLVKLRRLINRETGEVVDVDPRVSRVRHMRRRIHAWAETVQLLDVSGRLVMDTLTYRPDEQWQPDHISKFMQETVDCLQDKLLAYCWVAELQERGAVHYHVLLMVKRGTDVPMPDKSLMWSHGSSNRGSARSAYYLMKYTQKGCQGGEFPRGARVLGASWRHLRLVAGELSVRLSEVAQRLVRESLLPMWVLKLCESSLEVMTARRHRGGGWVVGDAVYRSPWAIQWVTEYAS
jgi:hypothetical protein